MHMSVWDPWMTSVPSTSEWHGYIPGGFPTLLFSNLFNEFYMKNHENFIFWQLFIGFL